MIVVSDAPTEIATQYNIYGNVYSKSWQINRELTVYIDVDASGYIEW